MPSSARFALPLRAVARAFGRALRAQSRRDFLLLSLVPFLLALALWLPLLWYGLPPLGEAVRGLLAGYGLAPPGAGALALPGLLLALLLLAPLMMATALLFLAVAAMPAVARRVGARDFPHLEKKRGGSWFGGLCGAGAAGLLFALAWCLSLPLYLLPPLAPAAHVLLWGWLSCRLLAYDALADYASAAERRALLRRRRWPLLAIGVLAGLAGSPPGLLWLGAGLLSPLLAAGAIWLFVLICLFTGLWFEYYCLQELTDLRAAGGPDSDV